jgi:hypothetical protein
VRGREGDLLPLLKVAEALMKYSCYEIDTLMRLGEVVNLTAVDGDA